MGLVLLEDLSVKELAPGGTAAATGLIAVGDRLVGVNSMPAPKSGAAAAVKMIVAAKVPRTLTFRPTERVARAVAQQLDEEAVAAAEAEAAALAEAAGSSPELLVTAPLIMAGQTYSLVGAQFGPSLTVGPWETLCVQRNVTLPPTDSSMMCDSNWRDSMSEEALQRYKGSIIIASRGESCHVTPRGRHCHFTSAPS